MLVETKFEMKEFASDSASFEVLSATMTKSLNKLSNLALVLSSTADHHLFKGDAKDFILPTKVAVQSKSVDSSGNKIELQLFRGFLESYTVAFHNTSLLSLNFIDPLIACDERDDPRQFHKKSLKEIVDQLLSNAFSDGQSFGTTFVPTPPKVGSATNMGSTDLAFIGEMAKRYGYAFYYNHSEKNKFSACFFRPDFSAKKTPINESDLLEPIVFKSRLFGHQDHITVHGGSGQHKESISNHEASLPNAFKPKRSARKEMKIEFSSHYYMPNFDKSDTRELANSLLMNALYEGDTLTFTSVLHLELGSLFEVVPDKQEDKTFQRMKGVYLLSSVESKYARGSWIHRYTGVRP